MEQKETSQPQHTEANFNAQTQVALDLGNGVATEPQAVQDDEFFNAARERARYHVDIANESDGPAQSITVKHPDSIGRRAAATGVAIGLAIGTGAVASGPIGQLLEDHIEANEEQNQQWVQEQQEAERKMVQDNQITIDLPAENSENK